MEYLFTPSLVKRAEHWPRPRSSEPLAAACDKEDVGAAWIDQGSEFVSRDLDLWAYAKGVTLDFSRPGKPTDTDVIE